MKKLENFYALFWILGLTLLVYAFFRVKQEIFRHRKPATEIKKPVSGPSVRVTNITDRGELINTYKNQQH